MLVSYNLPSNCIPRGCQLRHHHLQEFSRHRI